MSKKKSNINTAMQPPLHSLGEHQIIGANHKNIKFPLPKKKTRAIRLHEALLSMANEQAFIQVAKSVLTKSGRDIKVGGQIRISLSHETKHTYIVTVSTNDVDSPAVSKTYNLNPYEA